MNQKPELKPRLNCRQTRRALSAYVTGELNPRRRALVAQHLLTCESCDAIYQAQKQVSRELAASVPLVGKGSESGRFELMWREITAQIAVAPRPKISAQRLATGVTALLVGVIVALAWSPREADAGIPTPPTAVEGVAAGGTPVAVAFSPEQAEASATQTPPLKSNYAPLAGATDTP